MAGGSTKRRSSKRQEAVIRSQAPWCIVRGKLTRPLGRPNKVQSIFKVIGEKVPFIFIDDVKRALSDLDIDTKGVYIAHDSMGYPRYIGRGDLFSRLKARKKAQTLELAYFSFFVVKDKTHEREIETIMIRAAGPLLDFNDRKVRNDIQAGDVRDFEPGTLYVERQYRRGPQKKVTSRSR